MKREKQEKQYKKARIDFIDEQKGKHPQRKIFCYFCNREILSTPSLHHLIGRDNEWLLLKQFWVLSHNGCHLEYHSKGCSKIEWWDIFLDNIKKDYPDLYDKELEKMNK